MIDNTYRVFLATFLILCVGVCASRARSTNDFVQKCWMVTGHFTICH